MFGRILIGEEEIGKLIWVYLLIWYRGLMVYEVASYFYDCSRPGTFFVINLWSLVQVERGLMICECVCWSFRKGCGCGGLRRSRGWWGKRLFFSSWFERRDGMYLWMNSVGFFGKLFGYIGVGEGFYFLDFQVGTRGAFVFVYDFFCFRVRVLYWWRGFSVVRSSKRSIHKGVVMWTFRRHWPSG